MRSGAHQHHQTDTAGQRRPIARAAGHRVAARRRKNGTCGASPSFPFARLPQAANARGRMGPPSRVPAARTQLHVDDLLGHDAARMGASGEFVGLPLILCRLDHIRQDSRPIAHNSHPMPRPARQPSPRPETGSGFVAPALLRRTMNNKGGFQCPVL